MKEITRHNLLNALYMLITLTVIILTTITISIIRQLALMNSYYDARMYMWLLPVYMIILGVTWYHWEQLE